MLSRTWGDSLIGHLGELGRFVTQKTAVISTRPSDVSRPRTSSRDLSSAGSITSITLGSPETDHGRTSGARRAARELCVRSLLSHLRTHDRVRLADRHGRPAAAPGQPDLPMSPTSRAPSGLMLPLAAMPRP